MPVHSIPRYHINIFFSTADDCYIADIPDLRFCSASGSTPTEALEEALGARDAYLESCEKHGEAFPPARYRPAIYQSAVGE